MKLIKNFLYDSEPLEFDIKNHLSKGKLKVTFIFLKKLLRLFYKKIQRFFLRPSTRIYFKNIEKFLFQKKNAFVKNNEITEFNKNGLVILKNIFDENLLKKITIHLSNENNILTPVYTNHKDFTLQKRDFGVNTGYISTDKIVQSEEIFKLVNNEKLLNILSGIFKAKFKLDWIWSWWSFPSNEKIGPQLFHRDYESFNFVKLFVYLTDVGKENGPHEYIIRSNIKDKFFERKRFDENQIRGEFSESDIKTIYGKKGTTFLADTFGIHRGVDPKEENRLVLVYLFSIIPSNRSPKVPVVKFSNLSEEFRKTIKNKYIFDLFIDFN